MASELTVALDAMGGDRGPEVVVRGAIRFLVESPDDVSGGVSLILVGDKDILSGLLAAGRGARLPITIRHSSQTITMADHPAEALKSKPDSSIARTVELLRSGEAQAAISPGNTGAFMAACLFALGRIEGVHRPAIAATFPTQGNPTVVLDVGANIGCRAEHLYQFAHMGSAYSSGVFGIDSPRVALMNVGVERTKGSSESQEAYELLSRTGLNFTGNVEGDGILKGEADVVVCDGFIGNIILKFTESIADLIGGSLYLEMKRHWFSRAGCLLMRPAFNRLWRLLDSAEYGGAPLLGLQGVSIVAHGSSSSKAIKNAVAAACDFHRSGVNDRIETELRANAPQGG
ncbi:phosphate acyltransferase PlsX [Candidatus Fermentibacterales bacterium]|nr:phosphate acyltransferase PlsX [Candidatus Fermentibacterales bacterium]